MLAVYVFFSRKERGGNIIRSQELVRNYCGKFFSYFSLSMIIGLATLFIEIFLILSPTWGQNLNELI